MKIRSVVRQLIEKIKDGSAEWEPVAVGQQHRIFVDPARISTAYRTRVKDRYFVAWLLRVQVDDGEILRHREVPCLSLMNENFENQYDFYEDEYGDDEVLYDLLDRLKRKVNQVDEFLDGFLNDE